jgi:hypothetical protein
MVISLRVAALKSISALDAIHYAYGFIQFSHSHTPGCLQRLVQRNLGINFAGPSVNSTFKIMQVCEPLVLQKCDDLQTSGAVMANYDRGTNFVEILDCSWNLSHRQMFGTLNSRQLPFPKLANIQQRRFCIVG